MEVSKMRGMRKWKRWAVFLLLFAVLAVGGSRTAQAEMLDMTKYNDDLITVSKVPHGKAGNKISIKMTVHNNGSKGDGNINSEANGNGIANDKGYNNGNNVKSSMPAHNTRPYMGDYK